MSDMTAPQRPDPMTDERLKYLRHLWRNDPVTQEFAAEVDRLKGERWWKLSNAIAQRDAALAERDKLKQELAVTQAKLNTVNFLYDGATRELDRLEVELSQLRSRVKEPEAGQ